MHTRTADIVLACTMLAVNSTVGGGCYIYIYGLIRHSALFVIYICMYDNLLTPSGIDSNNSAQVVNLRF